MRLIDYTNTARQEISIPQLRSFEGPVMIFLGGLLHVQDIDTQGGFSRYLHKLKGNAPGHIVMPLDENCTDTGALNKFMFDYGHGDGKPSLFAQDIYKALYETEIEKCDLSKADQVKELKSHLSRFSLVGYSYGSSLTQQIAECMARHLSDKFGEDEFKGLKIFDICRSVKALNIGPVTRYHHIESDGSLNLLNHEDPYFSEAATIFSQVSFMMRNDKIIQKSFGNELLADRKSSDIGIECRHTASTTMIIDYVGKPYHKAIGYQQVPDGSYFAKIISAYDFILHDMRTYMNIHEKQGNLVVFPTLATASILRQASSSMMETGLNGPDWLERTNARVATEDQRTSLVQAFFSLGKEYADTVQEFEEREYLNAIEFLKDYVDGFACADVTPANQPSLSDRFPG